MQNKNIETYAQVTSIASKQDIAHNFFYAIYIHGKHVTELFDRPSKICKNILQLMVPP